MTFNQCRGPYDQPTKTLIHQTLQHLTGLGLTPKDEGQRWENDGVHEVSCPEGRRGYPESHGWYLYVSGNDGEGEPGITFVVVTDRREATQDITEVVKDWRHLTELVRKHTR